MQQWWLSNQHLDLGRYDRDAFEDLTGSIPLLLENCVVDGRLNLVALADVSREVLDSLMSLDRDGTGWSEYDAPSFPNADELG
jgi:Na+-translocating ferredoxin:NAD+ oxidoreductase RnfE subunit